MAAPPLVASATETRPTRGWARASDAEDREAEPPSCLGKTNVEGQDGERAPAGPLGRRQVVAGRTQPGRRRAALPPSRSPPPRRRA